MSDIHYIQPLEEGRLINISIFKKNHLLVDSAALCGEKEIAVERFPSKGRRQLIPFEGVAR